MPSEQFKDVICGPAQRATQAGRPLVLDPDLVDRLLEDCKHGSDTLPLLSLTLFRLYEDYGSSGRLSLADYTKLVAPLGGVSGQDTVDFGLHHPAQTTQLDVIGKAQPARGSVVLVEAKQRQR